MKQIIQGCLAVAVASLILNCQRSEPAADVVYYDASGVVRKVDLQASQMTVVHEEIVGYMPAMEMTVAVADASLLQSLERNDTIKFVLRRSGSEIAVTGLTKTGEAMMLGPMGSEIYAASCSECHGASGQGADKGIPLITGHALHHTKAEHIQQVAEGEGDKMPAFRDRLSADEIAAVVDFVRNDLQKNSPRDDSGKHKH